jgi:hypothetical protein
VKKINALKEKGVKKEKERERASEREVLRVWRGGV